MYGLKPFECKNIVAHEKPFYNYSYYETYPDFTTNKPIIFAVSAVAFIMFPFLVFLIYDRTMRKQQNEILTTANRSHAIVSSLFPSSVRDQLCAQEMNTMIKNASSEKGNAKFNLTKILGPPIAELYPETTVLFCDVVDFTKWSSGKINL